MYHKFFIGFFIAAFVCGIMLICGGVAEASMPGSFPNIQYTSMKTSILCVGV